MRVEDNNTAVLDRQNEAARLWETVQEMPDTGDDLEDSEIETQLGDEVTPDEPTEEATPAADATEEATDEAKADTEEKSQEELAYTQFMEEWRRDRVNLMQHLINELSPDELQRLGVGQADATQEQAERLPDDYVPASVLEESVIPFMDWITEGREFVQQNFVSRDDLGAYNEYLTQTGTLLNDAQARVHALEAQVDALQNLMGQTLPKADMKAIHAELAKGTTYQDAVAKLYKGELDKAIKTAKQAGRQRPNTPGNESNDMEDLPKGAKMSEIMRRMGING